MAVLLIAKVSAPGTVFQTDADLTFKHPINGAKPVPADRVTLWTENGARILNHAATPAGPNFGAWAVRVIADATFDDIPTR